MMMNDDAKKKKAMLILAFGKNGEGKPESEAKEGEPSKEDSMEEKAAGDLISAVKSGNKAMVVQAFKDMMDYCSGAGEDSMGEM